MTRLNIKKYNEDNIINTYINHNGKKEIITTSQENYELINKILNHCNNEFKDHKSKNSLTKLTTIIEGD